MAYRNGPHTRIGGSFFFGYCFCFFNSICAIEHRKQQDEEKGTKTTQANGTKPKPASPQPKLVVSHWAPRNVQESKQAAVFLFLFFLASFYLVPFPHGVTVVSLVLIFVRASHTRTE